MVSSNTITESLSYRSYTEKFSDPKFEISLVLYEVHNMFLQKYRSFYSVQIVYTLCMWEKVPGP